MAISCLRQVISYQNSKSVKPQGSNQYSDFDTLAQLLCLLFEIKGLKVWWNRGSNQPG